MTTTEEKEQMELERQLQESGLEGRATWQLSFATGDQRCMQYYAILFAFSFEKSKESKRDLTAPSYTELRTLWLSCCLPNWDLWTMHSNTWTTQVVVIRLPLSHGTRGSWSCASILSLKASASSSLQLSCYFENDFCCFEAFGS